MMSFCNQKVHPILSLPNSNNNGTVLDFSLPHHHQNIFTTSLFESTAIIPPPYSTTSATVTATAKRDPGGIGFLDEVGGRVDGLMSCTESLGFESSDERTADDQIEHHLDYHSKHDQDNLLSRKSYCSLSNSNSRWQRNNLEKKEKKFPPPLSSLNQDGKRNFFLRAVRKDGRLELKEVKIGRPETLLASRQDGRLRLHLIRNDEQEDEVQQDHEDELELEQEQEQEEENEEEVIEAIEENNKEVINDKEQEDENVTEWKLPVTRRCYELTTHHHHGHVHGHHHHGHSHGHNNHHHDLHVWRQPCVTTR